MSHRHPALPCAALLLALLAPSAAADRLVTNDGRLLNVKKARQLEDGSYQLVFESGEVRCPARYVVSVEIEGDMSDYVPQSDDERKKLADGYVRYAGKWMSKAAYQVELNRQAEERRQRTEELAKHAKFRDGWETETKHFRIKTNTSPELLEYYADLLESYYDLMDKRVGINPSPTLRRTKMQVNVYKSYDEFLRYTEKSPGVLGFFSFIDEELQFYHDYQDPDRSNWVALHEGTHLLTYLIEPQAWPQIWVNEAVADYFGSASIARDAKGRLTIESGQPQYDRILTVQQAIADEKYVPLETLFFIEKPQFQGFEYAHAWSFVYFLNNSSYEKGFKKFFKDFYTIAKGVEYEPVAGFPNKQRSAKIVPPEEVRRLLLDKLKVKDTAKLEAEWIDFVRNLSIDAPQARFKRALRSFATGELARGLEDVQAAMDGGVDDPRAYWARAMFTLILKGDRAQCRADLEKALEMAPLNAGFHNNMGQFLAGLSISGAGFGIEADGEDERLGGAEEDLPLAETHFGLACELAPENDHYRETREHFLELLGAGR